MAALVLSFLMSLHLEHPEHPVHFEHPVHLEHVVLLVHL